MSSAQIVASSVLQNSASARMFGTPGIASNPIQMHTMLNSPGGHGGNNPLVVKHELVNPAGLVGLWVGVVSYAHTVPGEFLCFLACGFFTLIHLSISQ